MSETITLPEGTKVTTGERRYKLAENAIVDAVLVDAGKPQTNMHLALICPDKDCQEFQRTKRMGRKGQKGRVITVRTTRGSVDGPFDDIEDGTARPFCGVCKRRMVWRDEAWTEEETTEENE